MESRRGYVQTTRAETAERTRLAVLGAAAGLTATRPLAAISLEDVAGAAGVSLPTVVRKFGSRAALLDAATEQVAREVGRGLRTPVGDVETAVEVVVAQHERHGDGVLLLLAQEQQEPLARRVAQHARRRHRAWVETVFAPYLPSAPGPAREELVDLFSVATDLRTWHELRRGRGLDRATTTDRLHLLVTALL